MVPVFLFFAYLFLCDYPLCLGVECHIQYWRNRGVGGGQVEWLKL